MSIFRSLAPRALIVLALVATLFSVAPRPAAASSTSTWKTLVMVYRTTDTTYTVDGVTRRLRSSMTSTDVSRAVENVKRVPGSVNTWSGGYAGMRQTIVYPANPIRSVTSLGSNGYWLGPSNIKADLDWFAPPGRYDSIFVIWRHDDDRGNAIPSYGWGWTIGPSTGANGAGYSVVNIPDAHKAWPGATPEQIWMHEWTHQTIGFYGRKGWAMPDIHAPASYGYLREQYGKIFLSDVMRGRVPTSSGYIGLTGATWSSGTPTGNYTPRTGSASPSTATSYVSSAQTATMTYSDSNGWKDIRWATAQLISSNGRPAVSLLYNRSTNRMYVRSRDGARWIGGYAPGSSNTIAAGHATVKVKASSVSGSDNTLTVRWSVVFESPTRGGNYGVNLRVTDRNDAIA
ncbi:MAG: hypothetical protein M3506_09055, partial [Chloroflexota bacterium]|nr:hypothetical protein [Chloroflexota bacterium]